MFRINEEKTRKEYIDPELEKAGWFLRDLSRVGIAIPVTGNRQSTPQSEFK